MRCVEEADSEGGKGAEDRKESEPSTKLAYGKGEREWLERER